MKKKKSRHDMLTMIMGFLLMQKRDNLCHLGTFLIFAFYFFIKKKKQCYLKGRILYHITNFIVRRNSSNLISSSFFLKTNITKYITKCCIASSNIYIYIYYS